MAEIKSYEESEREWKEFQELMSGDKCLEASQLLQRSPEIFDHMTFPDMTWYHEQINNNLGEEAAERFYISLENKLKFVKSASGMSALIDLSQEYDPTKGNLPEVIQRQLDRRRTNIGSQYKGKDSQEKS